MLTTKQKKSFIQILKKLLLKVSNAALKTVDYRGGLDNFLKIVKTYKLSNRAKRLKSKIIAKV